MAEKKEVRPRCELFKCCETVEASFEDVRPIYLLRGGWGRAFTGWMPNSKLACKKCRRRLLGKWRYRLF